MKAWTPPWNLSGANELPDKSATGSLKIKSLLFTGATPVTVYEHHENIW
jgi:hypothetical protein